MFRLFDVLVLTAAILALGLSAYLFIYVDKTTALYVGLWVPIILGFGIHIKLLRIVHFVRSFKFRKTSIISMASCRKYFAAK